MFNMNRVTLLGRAGHDPEIRTMQNGGTIAKFTLATTEKWRKDGKLSEATEWHRIVVFGPAAEAAAKLVRKGCPLLVEGRIAGREYRDKEDQKHRTTEIVVAGPQGTLNVLSPRKQEDRDDDAGGDPAGTGDRAETGDSEGTAGTSGTGGGDE